MSERVEELHDAAIGKVVRAYEKGVPLKDIAERVGVSPPTVSKWLTQEGYKHKKKGRLPLAMKARVRDLHLRGWETEEISRLLKLDPKVVEKLESPKENPILGGEKDPLKIKGQKSKKKKTKNKGRGRPRKKVKEPKEGWPPPRHKCRKHWTPTEKAFVLQLIERRVSPAAIYKRMRASRKRQMRIWREFGNKGRPPNFPPEKDSPVPPGPRTPPPAPAKARELAEADESQILALEAEAAERRERLAALEAAKEADEARLKELESARKKLSGQIRDQAKRIELAEAVAEKRKELPAPKPEKRRVVEGSYEHEVLGLKPGDLVEPGKPGRPKTKKSFAEYADNRRYFVVSNEWADLKNAKPDELQMLAAYLTKKRFPTRVERSGDQPKAYLEGEFPKRIETRWVKAVDSGLDLLERYREKKLALRKNKMFSKRILAYLLAVFDGYRNRNLNSSQRAEAREKVLDEWARLSKLERLVLEHDMGLATDEGKPTAAGIERSIAARVLAEKAKRRAQKKLTERRISTKKKAIQQAAEKSETKKPLPEAPAAPALPAADDEPASEEDEIAAMLAEAQQLALGVGDDEV